MSAHVSQALSTSTVPIRKTCHFPDHDFMSAPNKLYWLTVIWICHMVSMLCVILFRTRRHCDWSSVCWRWWLPRDVVCHRAAVIKHHPECPFVDRMMWQEPSAQSSMLPATRRSCVARTVRTATAATQTSASLHMDQANFERLPAIHATRPNSARHTTPPASVPMVPGNSVVFSINLIATGNLLVNMAANYVTLSSIYSTFI